MHTHILGPFARVCGAVLVTMLTVGCVASDEASSSNTSNATSHDAGGSNGTSPNEDTTVSSDVSEDTQERDTSERLDTSESPDMSETLDTSEAPDTSEVFDTSEPPDTSADPDTFEASDTSSPPDVSPDTVEDEPLDPPPHGVRLGLIYNGAVLASGASLDLGERPQGFAPMVVEATLSNPSETQVTFEGDPSSWLISEPPGAIVWDNPPPTTLDAGATASVRLSFGTEEEGMVDGSIALRVGADLLFEVDLRARVTPPWPMVVVGEGGHFLTSFDYGASWPHDLMLGEPGHNESSVRDVSWGAGRFIAVGGNQTAAIWASEDGLDWQTSSIADRGWIGGVAYGNGRFVTVGGFGNLAWSTDGETWIPEHRDFDTHLRRVAFGNDRFVAVGGDRRSVTMDGVSWVSDTFGNPQSGGLVFGNGVFVTTSGDGNIASTTDGITWNDQVIGTARRSVVFGNGLFVAGGWPDPTITSTDGVNWTERDPVGIGVDPFGYGNGWFIGTSWRDRLYRSRDGYNWELIKDNSPGEPPGFSSIAFPMEETP